MKTFKSFLESQDASWEHGKKSDYIDDDNLNKDMSKEYPETKNKPRLSVSTKDAEHHLYFDPDHPKRYHIRSTTEHDEDHHEFHTLDDAVNHMKKLGHSIPSEHLKKFDKNSHNYDVLRKDIETDHKDYWPGKR